MEAKTTSPAEALSKSAKTRRENREVGMKIASIDRKGALKINALVIFLKKGRDCWFVRLNKIKKQINTKKNTEKYAKHT